MKLFSIKVTVNFLLLTAFNPLTAMETSITPFAAHIQLQNHQITPLQEDTSFIPAQQIQALKKEILHNPRALLKRNIIAFYNHHQTIVAPGTDHLDGRRKGATVANLFNENIIFHHQKNPLCFLSECYRKNCKLTRFIDATRARCQFEAEVVKEIKNQTNNNNSAITVVDVGAGGLFQDLVIVTAALEQFKTPHTINLCCIDRDYKQYIKATAGKTRWDSQRSDHLEHNLHGLHAQFAQLYEWFHTTFNNHTVNLFIFGSVKQYVKYAKQRPALKANIYMGSDLDIALGTPPLSEYIKRLSQQSDTRKYKNGHEAYLSAPILDILQPTGVGLLLMKGNGHVNHCLKLLEAGAQRPTDDILINEEQPTLGGRYFIVYKSYRPFFGAGITIGLI